MNVMFVSQCDKRALTETRRILDQFAERKGDRTWQTPITQAGLDTVRTLLRKTARKNSAIACHWIRGRDHTELLWIVGDRRQFGLSGATPTNSTKRNMTKSDDEHLWHHGALMSACSALASLLHDIGKACQAFQDKLTGGSSPNHYRHEWISLRLWQGFVGKLIDSAGDSAISLANDQQWLRRLADGPLTNNKGWNEAWLGGVIQDGVHRDVDIDPENRPLHALRHAPLAQAIGWLIVSHHRLPDPGDETVNAGMLRNWSKVFKATWNGAEPNADAKVLKTFWAFKHGLPMEHPQWRKDAARQATRLQSLWPSLEGGTLMADPYVMHICRLSLMLADHHYSSLHGATNPHRVHIDNPGPVMANTHGGQLNQSLIEHLIGVAKHSQQVSWALPKFERDLPRLADCRALRKCASGDAYQWQNKAFDAALSMRARTADAGAFIVNMASTGCGKTLANARTMYALADPTRGMRCAFAMGLRTLTMQTGRAFKELLSLDEDDLAVRVGDAASRELFAEQFEVAEETGSASSVDLLDNTSTVLYEGNPDSNPLLSKILSNPQARGLLLAPLLVCTIDHLTPATESERGGRQIAPMLRLLSGDLVLDEPDDFDLTDLPALSRLVNWAGLLGARVLLSSATLPPALVGGLFEAYRAGRAHFIRHRARQPGVDAAALATPCLWIDEFGATQVDCAGDGAFGAAHVAFVARRVDQLAKQLQRRRFALHPFVVDVGEVPSQVFASRALQEALALHSHNHQVDPATASKVSFGLIRMANIKHLYPAAIALYKSQLPPDTHVHLCTYHSQFPLILRSEIERVLDRTLDRRKPATVFDHAWVRQAIDAHPCDNHVFVVLGSPVTEVGRDHDYDWAVVEPSSMRSLIQLAGRVRRHRGPPGVDLLEHPNIVVFSQNIRATKPGDDGCAFKWPGFEDGSHRLDTHDLAKLLPPELNGQVDARPRIQAKPSDLLQPKTQWADLEHLRMQQLFAQGAKIAATQGAACWWHQGSTAHLTAMLQQRQEFRREEKPRRVDLCLEINEDGDAFELVQLMRVPNSRDVERVSKNDKFECLAGEQLTTPQVSSWAHGDYLTLVATLAESRNQSVAVTSARFGRLSLKPSTNGWQFSALLGMRAK